MSDLLSPKAAVSFYGVDRYKLDELEKSGKIHVERTTGGHRRYLRESLDKALVSPPVTEKLPSGFFTELGNTGTASWRRYDFEEQLKPLQGRSGWKIYREMRMNDPVIAAIFFALGNTFRQANWRVKSCSDKPADKEVAEFADSALHDFSWSWSDQLTFTVDPLLEQGCSYLEKVFKRRQGENGNPKSEFDDNRIGWRRWAPRPMETLVEGDEWKYDANGDVLGGNQEVEGKGVVFLPLSKCLLFRTTVHPANVAFGVPIHRPAYTSWYFSQNIAEIEGIGIERDLAGIPVMYMGTDCTMSGTTSDYEIAKDIVVNLRNDEQTGIVIPKPKMGNAANPGEGMLLELLNTGGTREFDTTKIIERYDKRKAVTVLAQFILLGMDRVGSYALSKNQSDLFVLAAKAWLQSIADIINMHAIPELIRYNVFPKRTGYPELVPGTLGIPDLAAIAEFVNKMVQSQVLTPDEELERHIRQIGGLPPLSINVRPKPQQPKPDKEKQEPDEEEETEKLEKSVGNEQAKALEKRLQTIWDDFAGEVKEVQEDPRRDELTAMAVAILLARASKAFEDSFATIWRGITGEAGDWEVAEARQRAMGYLNNFATEIQAGIGATTDTDELAHMLDVWWSTRLKMYAGEAWLLYQKAKVWGQDPNSIWKWVGPNDGRTCVGCRTEIAAGDRPLHQIRRRPGDCECLSNCRCDLVKVRRAPEPEEL